ncbi:MAG: DsrE family protein [Verrucomicrobiota bacterium]|nr:DsrE family protein [Verrucomicrobiota bacterium]
MESRARKLAILLAAPPGSRNFTHAIKLADAAQRHSVEVYLYCLDEAVAGITQTELQSLKGSGVRLFGCAYAAQKRSIAISDSATFAGLATLSDLIAATDRFVTFA